MPEPKARGPRTRTHPATQASAPNPGKRPAGAPRDRRDKPHPTEEPRTEPPPPQRGGPTKKGGGGTADTGPTTTRHAAAPQPATQGKGKPGTTPSNAERERTTENVPQGRNDRLKWKTLSVRPDQAVLLVAADLLEDLAARGAARAGIGLGSLTKTLLALGVSDTSFDLPQVPSIIDLVW